MKFLKGLICGVLFVTLLHIWMLGWGDWRSVVEDKWNSIQLSEESSHFPLERDPSKDEASTVDDIPVEPMDPIDIVNEDLFIGMSATELRDELGEPARKDPSAYGYEWWIYNDDWKDYIQIGIYQNKVVMFYTNSSRWSWGKMTPGMAYSEWKEHWVEQSELSFHHELGYFTFTLSEQDVHERPLIIDEKTAIQLYVDIHDQQKISGIRVMDLSTLLLHRPYALKYIGKIPASPELTENEWVKIEQAYEKQIFDIVNVTRHINQLPPFEWHDDVATVAKGHSQDMLDHQFFDHLSPGEGELSDRLDKGKVAYRSAGENIAWNYIDAADAHEGWMNSLGHRKNVVKPEFTHLGVGIVEKYYTQNFLSY